jgi:hypothetical protein
MFVKPIIFLGPSLPRVEATTILDADYRPPLSIGDLDDINSQAIVGIVDGVLDAARLPLAEAQRAIDRGVSILGAASTGALLASDCRLSGIVGLGRVFTFLSRFSGNREDLIASLYAEHDNTLLTVPLINVVLAYPGLRLADAQTLATSLCDIPMESRSLDRINDRILDLHPPLAGLPQLSPMALDAKSNDARLLLRHVQKLTALR